MVEETHKPYVAAQAPLYSPLPPDILTLSDISLYVASLWKDVVSHEEGISQNPAFVSLNE